MQCLGDLVCASLHTGARIPLLGYTPVNSDTNGSALECALHTGYRQLVLDVDTSCDVMVGTVIKIWYTDGKINRDDLFVAVKVDIKSVNRMKTKVTQRLHDLNCGYFDCLIMCKCEDIANATQLQKAWQSFEKLVESGHARSLGIGGVPAHTLEKLTSVVNIPPVLYMMESDPTCQRTWSSLASLERYVKKAKMQLLLSLGWDSAGVQVHFPDQAFQNIVSKYRRSPCQILVRYLRQRGLIVVCNSSDSSTLQDSFKVYDFLLENQDLVSISKQLHRLS